MKKQNNFYLYKFFYCCLQVDPAKRIDANQLLELLNLTDTEVMKIAQNKQCSIQ